MYVLIDNLLFNFALCQVCILIHALLIFYFFTNFPCGQETICLFPWGLYNRPLVTCGSNFKLQFFSKIVLVEM